MTRTTMTDADILGTNIDAEAPKGKAKSAAPVGLPDTIKIILEENDNIPPTGLFVGCNGRGYLIRPGETVNIPTGVREILDHAITSAPQIDPSTRRVIGYRDRQKYPYRVVG